MKLLGTTLHYITRTNEDVGVWTEKIICDILKIPFNSKREYLTDKNYPFKLKRDINSLVEFITPLNISEHVGNKNYYYDFKTTNGNTVSLKTNINGSKICPQNIGQVSLQKFNEQTKYNLKSTTDYKALVLNDTAKIVDLYLSNLFCCNHLLSFKFDKGELFHFQKLNEKIILDESCIFKASKELSTWNNSLTLSIIIQGIYKPLCEFQVHNSRNCIQCRFNLDTIVLLVNNGMIKNINVNTFKLKHKYNIKVLKTKFDEMEDLNFEGLCIAPKKRKILDNC
jgi:hypothetical protein